MNPMKIVKTIFIGKTARLGLCSDIMMCGENALQKKGHPHVF